MALLSLTLTGCIGGGSSSTPVNPSQNADAKDVTLSISANAILGGKSDAEAVWITKSVIPKFEAEQKAKGVNVKVSFNPSGVEDEAFKSKMSLALKAHTAADLVELDGIWTGEFADAGYIKPLNDVVGKEKVTAWDGWKQIQPGIQQFTSYNGQAYGIPEGTDGRVIYFNKKLFQKAGLPADWQPKSWADILSAAEKLKSLSGVTPLQINAGTPMGEATTMQGFLPLLQGTGQPVYKDGKWQGASQGVKDVLDFYGKIYGSAKLGDPLLQQETDGRSKSFQLFADGKLGIIIEGDYLWRSVINPKGGIAPMADRDTVVGWAKIPAQAPGKGVNGTDFVSMSGGGGVFLNPDSKYPQQAWELLTFMNSAKILEDKFIPTPQLSARDDVNAAVLGKDPLLTYIAKEVLPVSGFRPGVAVDPQVSLAIEDATGKAASGTSGEAAAQDYEKALEQLVDKSNVFK
ncbi:extracellular solute-binding protein [Paenarthrobacter sp. Z7-10]|nr:extracellular solute-binding protein [Paenarthrobacter sp. Z7-10]